MSSIVLVALSPVFQAKLCRGLCDAARRRLDLAPDDAASFATAVELGCGRPSAVRGGLAGLLDVGRLADAYGIEHVHRAVEWEAARRLTVDTCAELLVGAAAAGMPRLARTCRELARGEPGALAQTEGFALLGGERALVDALGALVDPDGLPARDGREPAALEQTVSVRSLGGAALGQQIHAETRAHWQVSGTDAGRPLGRAQGPRSGAEEARGAAAAAEKPEGRRGWYAHAGAPRRAASGQWIDCLVVGEGLAAWKVPRKISALARRDLSVLAAEDCSQDDVRSMAIWREWIAVGHQSGQIEIWEGRGQRSLKCIGALDCSVHPVSGLGSTGGLGPRLVSESTDAIQVWKVGGTFGTWALERSIDVRSPQCRVDGGACCFSVSGALAAAAHYRYIRVWDLDSGAICATFSGHQGDFHSIAVDAAGRLVVSVSADRTLRVWAIGKQTCLRTLDLGVEVLSVALSEGKIFGGLSSVVRRGAVQTEAVHVWDQQTLELEGTLWVEDRPAGSTVRISNLVVDKREVWAQLSNEHILVWGWKISPETSESMVPGRPSLEVNAPRAPNLLGYQRPKCRGRVTESTTDSVFAHGNRA